MMKMYPSWYIFLFLNILGVSLIISTSNWFMAWIGLELTLLGFLPMTIANFTAIESLVKYLLIQTSSSSLFLFAVLTPLSPWLMDILTMLSMLVKMGLFPFFQWVPVVMSTLPWMSCLILTTLQKLGPIFLVMNFQLSINSTKLLLLSSTASILTGGFLGLNQTKMRPLMAYSSISHTGWIMSSVPFSTVVTTGYMSIYFSLSVNLLLHLNKNNMNKVVPSVSYPQTEYLALLEMITVLSGMPPFSIFFAKMITLSFLVSYPVLTIMAILGTMMSSYYYWTIIIPYLTKPLKEGGSVFFVNLYALMEIVDFQDNAAREHISTKKPKRVVKTKVMSYYKTFTFIMLVIHMLLIPIIMITMMIMNII